MWTLILTGFKEEKPKSSCRFLPHRLLSSSLLTSHVTCGSCQAPARFVHVVMVSVRTRMRACRACRLFLSGHISPKAWSIRSQHDENESFLPESFAAKTAAKSVYTHIFRPVETILYVFLFINFSGLFCPFPPQKAKPRRAASTVTWHVLFCFLKLFLEQLLMELITQPLTWKSSINKRQ